MLKGQHLLAAVEENMSNLTSASNEASGSSVHQYFHAPHNKNNNSSSNDVDEPPAKRKRNLPGHPDPDAEVIALSPKTLMATNRFLCEVCGKGFQRDQNLQLHRRGHNLPWKLKQRSTKEAVRKKVYVCPEKMCVHNEPSRALGDLTGIKKHFSRKHGEKKYKCEKCAKKYAVMSDWKAHSKTCGTREYRCDCGTLFSRRDSFITHRAFCDALAEESGRGSNNHVSHQISSTISSQENQLFSLKKEQNHGFNPPWLASNSPEIHALNNHHHQDHGFDHHHHHHQEFQSGGPHFLPSNPSHGLQLPPIFSPSSSSLISATALLQKASQMGATSSNSRAHQGHHVSADSSGFGLNLSSRDQELLVNGFLGAADKTAAASSDCAAPPPPPQSILQEMMTSSTMSGTGFSGSTFVDANFMINNPSGFFGMHKKDPNFADHIPNGIFGIQKKDAIFDLKPSGIFGTQKKDSSFGPSAAGSHDGMTTRDFLGLRPLLSQSEIFSIANLGNMEASEHHQESWQQG